jgi:Domain of unknown function (DUF4386)
MKTEKIIGSLLILGVFGVLIPYTILTIIFDYPNILRQDAGVILTKFHEGGASLIFVWFLFATLGLPLLIAYVSIGQKLENKFYFVRWATIFGIISIIVQIIGLLRWTFVVPLLANDFVNATNETTRETTKTIFQAVHQFGGVLLGEHLGQLFTVAWTIIIAAAFNKLRLFPRWVIWFGYISAGIYLLAQAEIFATVIPGFPVWNLAGLIGSTMWLIWLLIIGIKFLKIEIK